MANFIGRLVDLGVARESTRGTGVAPTVWVPKTSFAFDDNITVARDIAGLGKIVDSSDAFVVNKFGAGDIEMYLGCETFGYFLYSALGTLSTSGPTDSAYTHSFSIEEGNTHESLTLVVKDPNTTEMYKLAMVNTLEFVAELEDIVKCNLNFLSKRGVSSSGTPSYSGVDYKFTKSHIKVKVAANIAGLSGASVLSIKSLRLTLNQNVETDDSLSTVEPENILNKQLSVEGEISLNYTDETWKNYFTGGTHRSMEIKFVNTDQTIGGGSTNPSLTIQMPKVDFFTWAPDYSLDEIVTQTVSFKANYDITNSLNAISKCDLVNATSSY